LDQHLGIIITIFGVVEIHTAQPFWRASS